MPEYYTPGVYIEELPSPRTVEAVGTSTPAFMGEAPNSLESAGKPRGVSNWAEFERLFCQEEGSPELDRENRPITTRVAKMPSRWAQVWLIEAVRGFFGNGGRYCYIVNVKAEAGLDGGLGQLLALDDVNLIAAPGRISAADYSAIQKHCLEARFRFAILDAPAQAEPSELVKPDAEGGKGALRDKDGRSGFYFPWLEVSNVSKFDVSKFSDAVGGATPDPPGKSTARGRLSASSTGDAAAPLKEVAGPFESEVAHRSDSIKAPATLYVPPSGHMAGIYARTDATRGVFKAPANEVVIGALNVQRRVTDGEQDRLNPAGVNCIRLFAGAGVLIWGARTTAPSGSEWKYVNVRRLFNMIEESIVKSTRWVVFEPNDESLWKRIRRDVNAFLAGQWRQGALAGKTAHEAFFVKCDAESNPPDEVDRGRVNIVIGIAPVKPAEFVIFKIGQTAVGSEVA